MAQKQQTLGEIEQLVLLVIMRLGDDAYGMRVSDELTVRTGRDVAIGSVYAALDRLEKRGLICSRVGASSPKRGGRAKRYFAVERSGVEALADSRSLLTNLWDGLVLDPERYG
jgi:PadR family transcriptional regulator PadR